MTGTPSRLWISLVVLVLWGEATLFGARFLGGGEEIALDELVRQGIGWQFVAAIAILLVAIAVFEWGDIGFRKPHSVVRVLWFPSVYLVLFAVGILLLGTVGLASAGARGGEAAGELPAYATDLPIAMNLPNFIFALILLRDIHEEPLQASPAPGQA